MALKRTKKEAASYVLNMTPDLKDQLAVSDIPDGLAALLRLLFEMWDAGSVDSNIYASVGHLKNGKHALFLKGLNNPPFVEGADYEELLASAISALSALVDD